MCVTSGRTPSLSAPSVPGFRAPQGMVVYKSFEGIVGLKSLACAGCVLPQCPTLPICTMPGATWVSLSGGHSGCREGVAFLGGHGQGGKLGQGWEQEAY